MLQELVINLDLTAVFRLKKVQLEIQIPAQLNTFGNINITEILKDFRYDEFKTKIEVY